MDNQANKKISKIIRRNYNPNAGPAKIHSLKNGKFAKMDLNKSKHFLDFIFGLLQDVAYGTTKLNFSNGESQILLHAVVAARYAHIISYYIEFCENSNFEPLSETSLYRIVKALKTSLRRSLAGLGDRVAEGLNGFIMLEKIVDQYMGRKKVILEKLEREKRYLKIGFPQHCNDHPECPSHCIILALSDPKNPRLSKDQRCYEHGYNCVECESLFEIIDFAEIYQNELKNKDDLLYYVNISKAGIFRWMQNIFRHMQQDKAREECLD